MDNDALSLSSSISGARIELVPITVAFLAKQREQHESAQIPPELLNYKPQPYLIGPGDILQVTVWDHPELTSPAGVQLTAATGVSQQSSGNGRVVLADGSFYFPYVGNLKAAGMTVDQIRDTLTLRLGGWFKKPQVDVSVISFESAKIQVSGAFIKTEPQAVTRVPLSLLSAIGSAGINAAEADLSGFTLNRDGYEYHLDLDELNRSGASLETVYLKAGDHLHLPSSDNRKAYVGGEVVAPTSISFKSRTISLLDVLGKAGGLRQETANGDAIYVIRGGGNVEVQPAQVFHLAAKSPAAFALASQFQVQPQDYVFVGPAHITRWNRFISQLLPTSALVKSSQDISNGH